VGKKKVNFNKKLSGKTWFDGNLFDDAYRANFKGGKIENAYYNYCSFEYTVIKNCFIDKSSIKKGNSIYSSNIISCTIDRATTFYSGIIKDSKFFGTWSAKKEGYWIGEANSWLANERDWEGGWIFDPQGIVSLFLEEKFETLNGFVYSVYSPKVLNNMVQTEKERLVEEQISSLGKIYY